MALLFQSRQERLDRRIEKVQKHAGALPGWNSASKKSLRKSPRVETWALCSVELDIGGVWEGVMLDLSDTGARIRFNFRGSIASDVRIICPRHKINRRAQMVWQNQSDFGFKFIQEHGKIQF